MHVITFINSSNYQCKTPLGKMSGRRQGRKKKILTYQQHYEKFSMQHIGLNTQSDPRLDNIVPSEANEARTGLSEWYGVQDTTVLWEREKKTFS